MPAFDGERALGHVRQLVAIGPRVAGTDGAARARQYIRQQIEALGLGVGEQPFEARTPLGSVEMVNLRVSVPGRQPRGAGRILIAGHYDTKRFEEFAFVGANDGGSSTAFLIELARVIRDHACGIPLELVFFDGEEAVVEWRDGDHTYGSRHYVEAATKDGTLEEVRALILVDMIGERDLNIRRDVNSTGWLTRIIWNTARRLGRREFVFEDSLIEDDHLPFIRAGVPAVDIIDLEYSAWHTAEDTLDKVSAESLQAVAEVLLEALPAIVDRLKVQ